jgi:hypothetical protein
MIARKFLSVYERADILSARRNSAGDDLWPDDCPLWAQGHRLGVGSHIRLDFPPEHRVAQQIAGLAEIVGIINSSNRSTI